MNDLHSLTKLQALWFHAYWVRKRCHYTVARSFANCLPIIKILSL